MKAIRKGTTSWRETPTLALDEVEFVGAYLYEADGFTSAMVWDGALNNVRTMTQADRDARAATVAAQRKADAKGTLDSDERLKGVLLWALDEINTLRAAVVPALPARTMLEVRGEVRKKIDGL